MSVTPSVSTSLGDIGVWGAEMRTTPGLAFLPGGHLQTSLAIYSFLSLHLTTKLELFLKGQRSGDLMVSKPSPSQPFQGSGTPATLIYMRTPNLSRRSCPQLSATFIPLGFPVNQSSGSASCPWSFMSTSDPESSSKDKLPATDKREDSCLSFWVRIRWGPRPPGALWSGYTCGL